MTHQTLLELSEPLTVHTPLGKGTALIVTTPSYLGNSTWYVKLDNGEIKHFDSNDIRIYGSPTYGESLVPKIPHEWVK
jgi:hypothetical protein